VVIAYRYLLPKEEFKEFKKELSKLINKTVKKASTLTEEKLITAMGFPKNWKDISKYRV
jgi:deoxyhypusine synthase